MRKDGRGWRYEKDKDRRIHRRTETCRKSSMKRERVKQRKSVYTTVTERGGQDIKKEDNREKRKTKREKKDEERKREEREGGAMDDVTEDTIWVSE